MYFFSSFFVSQFGTFLCACHFINLKTKLIFCLFSWQQVCECLLQQWNCRCVEKQTFCSPWFIAVHSPFLATDFDLFLGRQQQQQRRGHFPWWLLHSTAVFSRFLFLVRFVSVEMQINHENANSCHCTGAVLLLMSAALSGYQVPAEAVIYGRCCAVLCYVLLGWWSKRECNQS